MSRHTHRCVTPKFNRQLPRGRAGLVALDVAIEVAGAVQALLLSRGLRHLRDHLVRAADNTVLRLSEAGGRTLGNRYQHLEAAYAEHSPRAARRPRRRRGAGTTAGAG